MEPRVPSLYETIPESSIVRRHSVARSETLPQLSLRYGVDGAQVLQLNNLMSPHLLQHRHEVFVPVPNLTELRGCSAAFEYSNLLCRDLLIATSPPDGAGQVEAGCAGRTGAPPRVNFNRMLVREMQAHVRRLLRGREGGRAGEGPGGAAGERQAASAAGGRTGGDRGGRRGGSAAGGGLEVAASDTDLASARYYLEEAGGCAQRAAQLFVEDLAWGQGGDPGNDTFEAESDEAVALIRLMAASDRPHRPAGSVRAAATTSKELVSDGLRAARKARRRRWRQRLVRTLLLVVPCVGCCARHRTH